MYSFKAVIEGSSASHLGGQLQGGDLVVRGGPETLVNLYGWWRQGQLQTIALYHGITLRPRATKDDFVVSIRHHQCTARCSGVGYLFRCLSYPRRVSQASVVTHGAREPVEVAPVGSSGVVDSVDGTGDNGSVFVEGDESHLAIASDELKKAIIKEWEHVMSTESLKEHVCAACARRTPRERMLYVKASKVDFSLLRNDALPVEVLPVSYNREAYNGAILHPKGLTVLAQRGDLKLCTECDRSLKQGKMPKYALANWLYYGHERLPEGVKRAFESATSVERVLVSRARASKVSFRFCQTKGHYLYGTDPNTSQSYVRGNVGIHPQDATHLNEYLPPSHDVIRDTICAVFVGQTKPTRETIAMLRPVLVRKSRVSEIIQFLTSRNPLYRPDGLFAGFSQMNMDALFGPGTADVDEGVACGMEIAHLESNQAIEGATSSYVPGEDVQASAEVPQVVDELLMENVGYTASHATPQDDRKMQLKALSHCLRGGSFLSSQAGSRFVPEWNNPNLLSWLFPHLDPWGIGGFSDPRRTERISFEEQLRYLLTVDESPFRDDPDFAFVFFSIKQKHDVFTSSRFRVSASQR